MQDKSSKYLESKKNLKREALQYVTNKISNKVSKEAVKKLQDT